MKKENKTFFIIVFIILINLGFILSETTDLKIKSENKDDIRIEQTGEQIKINVLKSGSYVEFELNGKLVRFTNLEAQSNFVFNKKELVEVTLKTSKIDGEKYSIAGYSINLPKDGTLKLSKENNNQILKISVPKDVKIVAPEVENIEEAKKTKLIYEPIDSESLKLPNEGSFTSKRSNSNEKTVLYFDPVKNQFYSEKPFKVDNLEVGTFKNSDSGKTYILFDSSKTNDLKENFLYLGSKDDKYKLMVGATGSNGASVRFVPTSGTINYGGIKTGSDDMLAIQARGINDRSVITVTSREGEKLRPLIQANGEYDMFHGNSFIEYTKEGGIRHGYLNTKTFNSQTIDFSKTSAITVEIDSKTSSGDKITQKFKDKSGKDQTALVDWNIFVDKNNLRLTANPDTQKVLRDVKFGQLYSQLQTKLLSLKKEKQLELINKDFNILVEELKKIPLVVFGENLNPGKLNNPPKDATTIGKIRQVKDGFNLGNQYEDRDPVTSAHETTHGINNGIRNANGGTGTVNGFYLPEYSDKYFILKEPNIKISDTLTNTPENLRNTGFYSLYLQSQQKDWNKQPLYILDELTAYTNGAMVSTEGKLRQSINIPEAMSASIALGRTIQDKDPSYWNSKSGSEFKEFLMISLERSMTANSNQYGKDQALIGFNKYLDQNSLNFLKNTYGDEWTARNFGR